MSEYGIKSRLINAASIEECNQGVRNNLDSKDCLITNSLFLDWLSNNGLNVHNGCTLDCLSLAFDYGTRSYEDERKHVDSLIKSCDPNDAEKMERLKNLSDNVEANKDKYVKISKDKLRYKYYTEGVVINWKHYNKDGTVRSIEPIKYKMLYRTPGKAKAGKIVVIREELHEKALNFLRMGIEMPDENAPIVEMGAYSSLVTSSIIGYVPIPPEDILILDDCPASYKTDVISIEVNENNECIAVPRNDYVMETDMFDGSALIDRNLFPPWADGYVLLRHHMTKSAAFRTDIQQYYKDYCAEKGIDYETFVLKDKWGNPHFAKDIKLIMSTNSCKWLKFNVSYEYWCSWVHKNGCSFGVVKTSHKSKLGDVQQMSYQMVNVLGIDSMFSVMHTTSEYINALQTDDAVFLEYLERNKNFSNDYDVLIALVNHNSDFIRSEYFKERRQTIIQAYIKNMKTGKLIQNADNLTLVGSPYAFLMHSVGLDPHDDPTFEHEDGVIQCYTNRFDDGEYLAEFRNPFNSRENLGFLHNHRHPLLDKYFLLGDCIIAVNVNGTDFCERNNGSDFDSDSIYTTNQSDIVTHAQYCYKNHKTIVNNIPKSSKTYSNTMKDFATVDNSLAKAQVAIGSSSNLAQCCLTYTFNYNDQKYRDYVCILAVLA